MSQAQPIERPQGEARPSWHALASDEVLQRLDSKPDGLTAEEAAERLERYGPNVIRRKKGESALMVLLRQLKNPLLYVLMGSGALAIVLGKPVDGGVVLAVVVLNSLIGFVQEYRAGRAIEALSEMVPETSTVVRDGRRKEVSAEHVVPGDWLELGPGDRVPADARVVRAKGLGAQEAILTGESAPCFKQDEPVDAKAQLGDRLSLLFGGTLITAGSGSAVVVATGTQTELGQISEMLQGTTEIETQLTKALGSLSRILTIAIGAVSIVLLLVGVLRGYGLVEALIAAIALAVAAIPEGLPAIVTIALAIGVQRMARRKAVIRRLPAVETLGSTTVICSDKTGTLTKNEMTVQELWAPGEGNTRVTGIGYEPKGDLLPDGNGKNEDGHHDDRAEDAQRSSNAAPRSGNGAANVGPALRRLLEAGVLCNDASVAEKDGQWLVTGDPTEGALVVVSEKAGLITDELRGEQRRLDAIPFESEHRYMATLNESPGGGRRILLKGAPEAVLFRCGAEPSAEKDVRERIHDLASQGMRVLAVASKQASKDATSLDPNYLEEGFELLGLAAMIDPPRPEAVKAIADCHQAGIVVKMITGDHAITAGAIARKLGIGSGEPVAGERLSEMTDEELSQAAKDRHVFARVAPEHKLRLVRALQSQDQIVAMTGDGVNDAPALEQANIGVAMGITGTSVSKESADVVLADDNFASIVAAVEEGRRFYDNLVKSLVFVLPTNLGLALILTLAVSFFPLVEGKDGQLVPLLPMLPTQILWINLVAAVALALPLALEAKEVDTMQRPPRAPNAPIWSKFVVWRTVLASVLMTACALGAFLWAQPLEEAAGQGLALREAQTLSVTTVIAFQIFYLLNCRSLRRSAIDVGLFSNPSIYVGIGVVLVAQACFIYLPPMQELFHTAALSTKQLGMAAALGALIVPVITLEKRLRKGGASGSTSAPSQGKGAKERTLCA